MLHSETTELVLSGKTQDSQEITASVPIRIVNNNDMVFLQLSILAHLECKLHTLIHTFPLEAKLQYLGLN